jgi:succinate-semialdehyde dehydrogenase / glutarate-semialdehyde dehydrogenase
VRTFQSINPYNQQLIAEYPCLSDSELDAVLLQSKTAFKHWKTTSFAERAVILNKVASLLRERKEELAQLITAEMGKILPESRAEIEKSAGNCEFYALNAEKMLRDEHYDVPGQQSRVVYDPSGCVLAIMPWNYPFWQVLRYAAPALMAGNVTILKHAPNVFGCGKAIETIFLEAGLPEGCFQSIVIDIPQVEQVIAADIVQGVTLTGSELAGSSVAALAGKHIKKTVLELGGSDPFIVLADADIYKAAKIATTSRMMNAGQACICAKRFMVQSSVYELFIEKFNANIATLVQGDPTQEGVHIGPLARLDLAQNLDRQLQQTVKQGAQLAMGGTFEQCNFQPTLLTHVRSDMTAFTEETFGPLATVLSFETEQDAIDIANNHRYGLATSLWTDDRDRAYHIARQLETGNVFVNGMVRSDSRLPFGGAKKSGYGRELSAIGIKEFMTMKTVVVE